MWQYGHVDGYALIEDVPQHEGRCGGGGRRGQHGSRRRRGAAGPSAPAAAGRPTQQRGRRLQLAAQLVPVGAVLDHRLADLVAALEVNGTRRGFGA